MDDVEFDNKLNLILKDVFGDDFFYNQHLLCEHKITKNHIYHKLGYILICASEVGNLKYVKFAIRNGATSYYEYDTPLRQAAMYGYLEIVKYLMKHGAGKSKNTHHWDGTEAVGGEVALYLALIHREFNVVDYLIEYNVGLEYTYKCARHMNGIQLNYFRKKVIELSRLDKILPTEITQLISQFIV